ncbi:MAG: hypothetical protein PHQ43_07885 [Dehalococcoidales bacterium]|nr:hypothetical protein [Dehalococcoidales bacterium]
MTTAIGVQQVLRGLVFDAEVTAWTSPTSFTAPGLAGQGAGFFIGWTVYVVRDIGGLAAAPQGESQLVTAYDTSSGRITHVAFTVPLAVGDSVYLLHPSIANVSAAILAVVNPYMTRTQGLYYYGVVTDVPGANQFTIAALSGMGANKFIDLSGANPYYAFVFRDAGGGGAAPQAELRAITGYGTATGNFVAAAFTVPVAIGDEMLILHPSLARIFNSAGVPGTNGNLAANWQAAEQTLCTVGAALTRYKVHNLTIGINALIGNITIRLYIDVNGVQRQIYPIPLATTFNVATDPPGIPIINSTFGIKNALRVTVQSDNIADNGAAVSYDYLLEAM